MHEPMTAQERLEKFKKWLRWAWWEVLLVVFAILIVHWFLISLDIVSMTVMQNGEVLGVVHGSDGEGPLSFISREECCVVSFAYEPGDGDAGYAVLGTFTRSRMCGLVFTVR